MGLLQAYQRDGLLRLKKTLYKFKLASLTMKKFYLMLIKKKYKAFKNNELSAIVATKSFGMGVNKPNIRTAIH